MHVHLQSRVFTFILHSILRLRIFKCRELLIKLVKIIVYGVRYQKLIQSFIIAERLSEVNNRDVWALISP